MQACLVADALLEQRYKILKNIKNDIEQPAQDVQAVLDHQIQLQKKDLEIGERSLTLTEARKHVIQLMIKSLEMISATWFSAVPASTGLLSSCSKPILTRRSLSWKRIQPWSGNGCTTYLNLSTRLSGMARNV